MKTSDVEKYDYAVHGDGISTYSIGIYTVLSAAALFVVILALEVVFYRMEDAEVQRKVIEAGSPRNQMALAAQQQRLQGYRWLDSEPGRIAIPISRAMQLVGQGYRDPRWGGEPSNAAGGEK